MSENEARTWRDAMRANHGNEPIPEWVISETDEDES